MTSSESPKINDPFKVLLRVGISIPLIIVFIVVWSYFIIQASMPLVKNEVVDIDCSSPDNETDCNNLNCEWTPPKPPIPGTTTVSQDLYMATCSELGLSLQDCTDFNINGMNINDLIAQHSTGTCSDNVDDDTGITSWDPFESFCENKEIIDSQIVNTDSNSGGVGGVGGVSGSDTVVAAGSVQTELQCKGNETTYNCMDIDVNDRSSKCNSDKLFDPNRKWCGVPGLDTIPSQGDNISIYDQKTRFHCCSDKIYEENINYTGLVLYLLVTIPIIFLLIEKLIDVFIFRDQPIQKNISNQFSRVGGYITDNGGKLVIVILVCYYLLLPLIRYFFVSYRCEGAEHSDSNCAKQCETDADCATTRDTGCYTCINNICSNPEFEDDIHTSDGADIQMSVCSIKSIIDDLTTEEINDIADQFGISTKSVSGINGYIGGDTTKEKMITSYYYKFYPRQELSVNDTNSPFRARLPTPHNPSCTGTATTIPATCGTGDDANGLQCAVDAAGTSCDALDGACAFVASSTPTCDLTGGSCPTGCDAHDSSIPGFDYKLNNYIVLNEDTAPGSCPTPDPTKNGPDNKRTCNENLNCSYVNGQCIDASCPSGKRYLLPKLNAINSVQNTTDLDLHNKVIRAGIDHGSGYDNIYPCNDVVISYTDKTQAKNDLESGKDISTIDGSWINEFELKRVECADKMGQCYMDDYVCETGYGVGIPLKVLEHPDPNEYTIGEFSDNGCQKAMYPCTGPGTPCLSLDYDETTGYLTENPNGGVCKQVQWYSDNWQNPDQTIDPLVYPPSYKCIPNNFIDDPATKNIITAGIDSTIPDAKVSGWVRDKNTPTTECKSVNRLPRSDIDNSPPSGVTNYYRWKSVSSPTNTQCSDWHSQNTCTTGKLPVSNRSYTTDEGPEDICCIEQGASTPVSLYAGGENITGTPGDINTGVGPIRTVSTVIQGR